jgi:hypothetical protein
VRSTQSGVAARKQTHLPGWIEAHLESREVAHVIYGSIIGLALVVALQNHPPAAGEMAAVLLGTALAVGLAELYAEVVAAEARTRHPVPRNEMRAMAVHALAVVFGAGFPAVFFVLAAASVVDLQLAFALSKWSGLGLICSYGFLAARLAGAGIARAVLHSAAVGAIGGFLIALKSLFH